MEKIAAIEQKDTRIVIPLLSPWDLFCHIAMAKFCPLFHLSEISISRLKPLSRNTKAHDLSLRNVLTTLCDGSLIISALDHMIRGYHQIILRTVVTQAGNGYRRGSLLTFFLVKTAIAKSLKDLKLTFYDIGIPVGRDNIKFLTKRDISGNGLLK